MDLRERIDIDFMEAYKAKEMDKKTFLGVLKASIESLKGKGIQPTNENVLKVFKTIEKGIVENIEGRMKAGMDTTGEELELKYLKLYQPREMSEDEIREIVKDMLNKTDVKNQGALMGVFNRENTGKGFDNKTVARIISEELS